MINRYGINRDKQISHNISKAVLKLRKLGFSGVFRNGLKEEHLLKAIGSNILPMIEYGLAIIKPTKTAAKKVDSFICGVVKNLCSIPRATPNEDVFSMYNFTPFFKRWEQLNANYLNRVSIREEKLELMQYSPKARMGFSKNKMLVKLANDNTFLLRLYKRTFPEPVQHQCLACMGEHDHVN